MSAELNVKKGNVTKCLLALALSTQVLTAWAQDESQADDTGPNTGSAILDEAQEKEESIELGRVQVTGSLLKREDFTSTSPMQVIDAETQFRAGQLTASEILQSSTVAAGTTQLNNQFGGFVVQGGVGVQTLDLRGLGANRTLVLLNGRRPGGSGTRGQVAAFDLTNIPDLAVQRFEIVADGSSSIYGSDAVSGVANVITRRSVDETQVTGVANVPLDGGGEFYQAGFITGLNFDSGSMTLSAQYTKLEALRVNDRRDLLGCELDLVTNAQGQNIDRENRSITAGTPLSPCENLYANTVIDAAFGDRYIPSPDGVTIGPIAGYRPRTNGTYANGGQAFYEDVLNFDFIGNETAINELERVNVYATADFTFGNVDWDAEFLYASRDTTREGWRQFFPLIGGANAAELFGFPPYAYQNDPTYNPNDPADPFTLALSQPVYPYPLNTGADVKFYYFTTGLSGVFNTKNYWDWQVYGTYSYSDGDYSGNDIDERVSGDVRFDANPPAYDPFDPSILSGANRQSLINIVGANTLGNTVYEQYQVTGIITGDLFDLPAGTVGTAIGLEYRDFSIDDVPDPLQQAGDSWGLSSATITKGSNDVAEAFWELEVPLLAGITGVENLTMNGSLRYFDYNQGGDDLVWKLGLSWQIVPSFRVRATAGTSYRAPALFEQFLGDQTAFAGQLAVDPCIDWGESSNANLQANCAAIGIPPDYAAGGSSALIITGGGVDNLESETSDSWTAGIVWTPEFTNLSVSLDYYNIEINDQIAQLGGASIASGCYTGSNFPNAFCDLLVRAPNDDPVRPNQIISINDSYVNVNSQTAEGVDLNLTWAIDYDWGTLTIDNTANWQISNEQQLFDPGEVEGFDNVDFVGDIGTPEFVNNLLVSATKGDWQATWFLIYRHETDASRTVNEETTYFGFSPAYLDITFDTYIQNNFAITYFQDKWDATLGVNNAFDEQPDVVSSGVVATRGNVPIAGTQTSLLGRTIIGRLSYRF